MNLHQIRNESKESEEQEKVLANINNVHNTQRSDIGLFNDFITMAFEARYSTIKGESIKI